MGIQNTIKALSDPIRREILEMLRGGRMAAGEISEKFPVSESEFSVSAKPNETLFALSNNDNVIYLNTFSKTISPSLRIGYMVLPKHLVETFDKKLGFYSCTVPTFMQYVLTELINNGDFERHINRVRRKKRKELSAQK